MLIRTAVLLSAATLLFPYRSAAECIEAPPAFFAKYATVVFSGTVTKIDQVDSSAWARGRAQFAAFNVDRVWKGDVSRQFGLYSFTRSVERYPLRSGTRYLFFARTPTQEERNDLNLGQRQAVVIGQCGDGTRQFWEASSQELAELGPGVTPRR